MGAESQYQAINFANAPLLARDKQRAFDYRLSYARWQCDEQQEGTVGELLKEVEKNKKQLESKEEKQRLAQLKKQADTGDKEAQEQLLAMEVGIALLQTVQQLMARIHTALAIAAKNKDADQLFNLEQILGRLDIILNPPQPPEEKVIRRLGKVAWVEYNQLVQAYNQNLEQLMRLAEPLTKHQHAWMRNVAITTIIMGLIAVIAFILLPAVPSFTPTFISLLSTIGALTPAATAGAPFGLGAAVSAGIIGAASGALVTLAGVKTLSYPSQQNRLARHIKSLTTATKKMTLHETSATNELAPHEFNKADLIKTYLEMALDNTKIPLLQKKGIQTLFVQNFIKKMDEDMGLLDRYQTQFKLAEQQYKQSQRMDNYLNDVARICGVTLFAIPVTEASAAVRWTQEKELSFGEVVKPAPKFIEDNMALADKKYRVVLIDAMEPFAALGLSEPTSDPQQLQSAYERTKHQAKEQKTYSEILKISGKHGFFDKDSDDEEEDKSSTLHFGS